MKKTHVLALALSSLALAGSQAVQPAAEIPQLERTKADLTQAIQEGEQRIQASRQKVRDSLDIGHAPKTGFLASGDPTKAATEFQSTHAGETLEAHVKGKGKAKKRSARASIKVRKK